MKLPSPHYAALRYLQYWFEHDEQNTAMLKESGARRLKALKAIATEYKVARTLPKAKERGARLEEVAAALDALREGATMPETVVAFHDLLHETYGSALSAATKFLWHAHYEKGIKRAHVRIYDSRAFDKLCKEKRIKKDDYAGFVEQWGLEYVKHNQEIAEACAELPALSRYLRDRSPPSEEELKRLTSEPWFCERVFDFMLWLE